jgi:hypothetical protein
MSDADFHLIVTSESSTPEGDPATVTGILAPLAAAMGVDLPAARAFLAAARTPAGVRVGISVAHDTGAFYLALDADREAVAAGVAGIARLAPMLSMFLPMLAPSGEEEYVPNDELDRKYHNG